VSVERPGDDRADDVLAGRSEFVAGVGLPNELSGEPLQVIVELRARVGLDGFVEPRERYWRVVGVPEGLENRDPRFVADEENASAGRRQCSDS